MSWKWQQKTQLLALEQKAAETQKKASLVRQEPLSPKQEATEIVSKIWTGGAVSWTLAPNQIFYDGVSIELKTASGQEEPSTPMDFTVLLGCSCPICSPLGRAEQFGEPYVRAVELLYRAIPDGFMPLYRNLDTSFNLKERLVMHFNDQLLDEGEAAAWFRRAIELTL